MQPAVAGAIDDPLDERLAAADLVVTDPDAEQLLDEPVVGRGLDTLAPHGLGDAQRVAADEPDGDGVDDPVDVADDHRDEGVEPRLERPLLG